MITLQDVQRGYDAWAAKPHNAKWVRKIDGTPIANDLIVNIFEALKDGGQEVEAVELSGVAEQLAENSGAWVSCTGCHETSEGVPTGPYSSVMKCHLGLGCRECGGIGAVWDSNDYSDFGLQETASASTELVEMRPVAWIDPVSLEHLREVNLTTTNIFAHKHSDYVAVYTRTASTALVEKLTKALEEIAKGETTAFDDDLQCDVEVSMDADEMSAVARAALSFTQSTTEEELRQMNDEYGCGPGGLTPADISAALSASQSTSRKGER